MRRRVESTGAAPEAYMQVPLLHLSPADVGAQAPAQLPTIRPSTPTSDTLTKPSPAPPSQPPHLYITPLQMGCPSPPLLLGRTATTSWGPNLWAGSSMGGPPKPLLDTSVSSCLPSRPPSISEQRRLSSARPRACGRAGRGSV
jgi:hypothetical protein